MPRRGENIYKRKDGRWEGRYMKGRRSDGKPIYGYIYARKYHTCKEKLAINKSIYIDVYQNVETLGAGLVSDFMKYWLHGIMKFHVKESTFSNYIAITDKWIIPLLGNRKFYKVRKEDVQQFVRILSENGLSPGSVRNIYRVLFSAMKKAREYGYIRVNPCEDIILPENIRKEAALLTRQEQKQLEDAARTDKNGFVFILALYTGLRVGELCALTWDRVDLESGLLHVSGTTQRIRHSISDMEQRTVVITRNAKSSSSVRTIPLPGCIMELFKEHRKNSQGEYVFTCKGHQLEPRVLQYRFKVLLKAAGIRKVNFHALRHTFATRCLELNFDVKTLSEILGHASAKMTLDRYGHSQMAHKRMVMDSLDRLYHTTEE